MFDPNAPTYLDIAAVCAGGAGAVGTVIWAARKAGRAFPVETAAMARLRGWAAEHAARAGCSVEDRQGDDFRSRSLTLRYERDGTRCALRFQEALIPKGRAGFLGGFPGLLMSGSADMEVVQTTSFRFNPPRYPEAFCLYRRGGATLKMARLGPARSVGAGGPLFRGPEALLRSFGENGARAELAALVVGERDRIEAGPGFVEWVVTGLPGEREEPRDRMERGAEFLRRWNAAFA